MIPSSIMKLDVLPLNVNGKVDKKKLPLPSLDMTKREIVSARNDIDKLIIDELKSILNIDNISIKDSFFGIGGDSLNAITLCTRLSDKLGISITVKDIFDNPTLENLSDFVSNNNVMETKRMINKAPAMEYYPISSAQKRIYFSTNVAGEASTLYNVPGGIILDSNVDTIKLERCLQTLISRHESLRTYFEIHNENVVQKVLNNVEFKLDVLDSQNFEDLHSIFADFVKPFDLAKAPLFRSKLITFTNGKSALLLDIHHIVFDGTSMSILVDELCKLYNGDTLSKLDITYKDYALFEKEGFDNGNLAEAENYWLQQFEGEIPVLNMPLSYSRPAIQSFEGKKFYFSINTSITKKIDSLARKLGLTTYMLLLSCYYILLSKYT